MVADTGDFNHIKQFRPEDATTNPTLILKACEMKEYQSLIKRTIQHVRQSKQGKKLKGIKLVRRVCDQLAVEFGAEILKIVPGYVSTEVDACLSFDEEATYLKAKEIIALYARKKIPKSRILIKIASTWEGIRASHRLEQEGIQTNMTLIFNYHQAIACAQAGATLISPFVGRILDWHKKRGEEYAPDKEPGVLSVSQIYDYFHKFGHKTLVMGASFRNSGEILALAGCDKLTIGPKFLDELHHSDKHVTRRLSPKKAKTSKLRNVTVTEPVYRWEMNQDAMATELLAAGIRSFNGDLEKLYHLVGKILKKH